jgi:excisionase family DNA binding protein
MAKSDSRDGLKPVLTPNEVADLLMVSPITVRQWAQKGMIEALATAGGHRRFTLDAVRKFATERGLTVPDLPSAEHSLLIVDDDRQLNQFLVALFTTEVPGLAVYSAEDGFEAGRLVVLHNPEVVLLDVMMPGIDGVDVCRRIKSSPKTAHVRVVGMTIFHTPEALARMSGAGAEALLKKPFSNAEVLAACGFNRHEAG